MSRSVLKDGYAGSCDFDSSVVLSASVVRVKSSRLIFLNVGVEEAYGNWLRSREFRYDIDVGGIKKEGRVNVEEGMVRVEIENSAQGWVSGRLAIKEKTGSVGKKGGIEKEKKKKKKKKRGGLLRNLFGKKVKEEEEEEIIGGGFETEDLCVEFLFNAGSEEGESGGNETEIDRRKLSEVVDFSDSVRKMDGVWHSVGLDGGEDDDDDDDGKIVEYSFLRGGSANTVEELETTKVQAIQMQTLEWFMTLFGQDQDQDESEAVPRRRLDTFGDSVVHVNQLYHKAFGVKQRKVPAHMPHMINKNIVAEMQQLWPKEWRKTR